MEPRLWVVTGTRQSLACFNPEETQQVHQRLDRPLGVRSLSREAVLVAIG